MSLLVCVHKVGFHLLTNPGNIKALAELEISEQAIESSDDNGCPPGNLVTQSMGCLWRWVCIWPWSFWWEKLSSRDVPLNSCQVKKSPLLRPISLPCGLSLPGSQAASWSSSGSSTPLLTLHAGAVAGPYELPWGRLSLWQHAPRCSSPALMIGPLCQPMNRGTG